MLLAYTFWHWRRADVGRDLYEDRHRAFHAALAAHPTPGFVRSHSVRLAGAPWANQGAEAWQDRYLVEGWDTLERLETGAVTAPREAAHGAVAALAAGGAAGLYSARLGAPASGAPRVGYWFSKPQGMSYPALDELVGPLVTGGAVLWMRRMVLGPTPEFCLEAAAPVRLPPRLSPLSLMFEPVWPG
jgi:hypothetical protein